MTTPGPASPADIDARIRDLPLEVSTTQDPDGVPILVLGLRLPAAPEHLWEAITDPARLARWSPIVPDRPLTSVGPALTLETPDENSVAADVRSVDERNALSHRWEDDELTWTLSTEPREVTGGYAAVPRTTHLELRTLMFRPELAPSYAAGWQVCLAVLEAQLEGLDQERIVGQDALDHGWGALHEHYARVLDDEAPPHG